jgi:endonuclease-3
MQKAILKDRVIKILKVLHERFPEAQTELNYSTPWELLVAVQLSAQSTDVQVNKVTEKLFKTYRNFSDYLTVDPKEFEKAVSSVNFYRNKARNILAAARLLVQSQKSKVQRNDVELPNTMEDLLKLPGVARKTANVILGQIFHKAEGIVVDTHVVRLAQKFGLTEHKDAVTIEKDLMEIVPKQEWIFFGNALVWYGRRVCKAKEHECAQHELSLIYPPAAKIWPKK